MRILAIETSGKTFSIAAAEGTALKGELFWQAGLTHSEKLIPSINWIFQEIGWDIAQIEKIAVSIGPGSFTGIRVGLACARTIAQHHPLPIVAVNTLAVLQAGIESRNTVVYPIIDALREEVFVEKKGKIGIMPIKELIKELHTMKKDILLVGDGVTKYQAVIKKKVPKRVFFAPSFLNIPRSGVLAVLAGTMKGQRYATVKPLYVRRSWAEEKNTDRHR